ncbi:PAS domain-containing sensor histidine kinase [Marinobacterium mangrovicola]|uniref:histidine kinase n=1 Tax=Marinobacterium mangrovicola TaxID=1476959 RepID=A0A4R1G852_9GAMM|nr:PAS domain-containing sensor histidine kinase [Marinobacterium mangrovicola]TCK04317.1 PAS domain S-box-containing protein [Marinobacterium mangrovicola]
MPPELNKKRDAPFFNERSYQVLVEQSLVGIYLIQDEVMRYCNSAFAAITGRTTAEIINKPIAPILTPESLQTVRDHIERRYREGPGATARFFTQARHVEGYLVDLEVHGRAIIYEGRPAVAGVAVNMTLQLNYQRELRNSHQQLQLISRYANRVREHQRHETARDIHDVLGGLLTSIKLGATRLLSQSDPGEIIEIAEDIIGLAQESIDFARHKSEQLYPATLNYLGLLPAIENLLKQQRSRSMLRYRLHCEDSLPTLSQEQSLVIYRTVQESLTNVIRHAEASQVVIEIRHIEGMLSVVIDDDGIGFDSAPKRENSFGLLFMRERAAEYGGELHAANAPLGGTRISLTLPVIDMNSSQGEDEND